MQLLLILPDSGRPYWELRLVTSITGDRGLPERKTSLMFSKHSLSAFWNAESVRPPKWGCTITLSLWRNHGSTFGSLQNTSSPALAIFPDANASFNAFSSTTAPRAVFTKKVPSFIAANSAGPIKLVVFAFRGQFSDTMSEAPKRSCSVEQYSALYFASSSGESLFRL